jgi:hypothetical protein
MAISTKFWKTAVDAVIATVAAINTRLTTAENSITTLETSDFISEGNNISLLTNDANYQTLSQVDAKFDALINSAPGTLNTLGEIATALADDDSAIAALVTVNNTQNTAIDALETSSTSQAASIVNLESTVASQETQLGIIETNIGDLLNRGNISRKVITAANFSTILVLTNTSNTNQHLVNNSGAVRTVSLPAPMTTGKWFWFKLNSTSAHGVIVNGVTLAPGDVYAIQYDGTEIVEW